MSALDLSVIVPVYNEAGSAVELDSQLQTVLSELDLKSEIIYVNDGSTDSTAQILRSHVTDLKDHTPVHLISLTRNQGQTAAISAGLDAASGKLIAFLDGDLQNHPSDIPKLIASLDKDTDAVFGWRKNRSDRLDRVIASRIANFLTDILFSINIRDLGCSLRIVRRESLEGLRLYGENHRLLSLLLALRGVRYKQIEVGHSPRIHDHSKYGYSRVIKLIVDLITTKFLHSYATKPAYIFGTWGLICLGLAIPALLQVIYKKLFLGVYVHLNPMFIIFIFLSLVGVQLVLMGLLAELLVRVYFESRQKPIYEINKSEKL